MRFLSFMLSSLLCVVVLASCDYPTPMPRGYVSFKEPYKSAPGEDAAPIGYGYSTDSNKTVLEDMRYTARDLVERLDRKLSFSVDEIYLSSTGQNAFYSSFDHLLRNELTRQGYLLSNTPHGAVHVDFNAIDPKDCPLNDDTFATAYRHLYLALHLYTNPETPPEIIGGYYEVPTYGFGGRGLGLSKGDAPPCISVEADDIMVEDLLGEQDVMIEQVIKGPKEDVMDNNKTDMGMQKQSAENMPVDITVNNE